jgi:hypothetical protein
LTPRRPVAGGGGPRRDLLGRLPPIAVRRGGLRCRRGSRTLGQPGSSADRQGGPAAKSPHGGRSRWPPATRSEPTPALRPHADASRCLHPLRLAATTGGPGSKASRRPRPVLAKILPRAADHLAKRLVHLPPVLLLRHTPRAAEIAEPGQAPPLHESRSRTAGPFRPTSPGTSSGQADRERSACVCSRVRSRGRRRPRIRFERVVP